MSKKFLILLGIVLFMSCCSTRTYTLNEAARSYLSFVGNLDGALAQIDQGEFFPLDKASDNVKYHKQRIYEISPGVHLVNVYKNDALVVERKIYVNDKTTFEIYVP